MVWRYLTFLGKKTTEEISTKFSNIFEFKKLFVCLKMFQYLQIIYCQHVQKALLPLLPTFLTALLRIYHFQDLYWLFKGKIGSVPLFLSFDMPQSHHHIGCHATSITSLLILFFYYFTLINIIKVNIIKIYTKNTHFIIRKCDITRTFIKKEYIIITE